MKKFIILLGFIYCFFANTYGQILNGDLTGSFETNNIYYFSDQKINALQPDNPFGSNNYIKLDYRKSYFSAGLQYEAYLPPLVGFDPLLEGNGIVFKYIQFSNNYLNITAGNFYEQFGSGLIFRSYEERAIGLNTAMDGVRISFKPTEYIQLKGIWGKQRKYLSNGSGTVRGIDGEFDVMNAFNQAQGNTVMLLGGSWVSRFQEYTGIIEDFPKTVDAWSGRLQFEHGFFSLYAEFIEKSKEPTINNQNSDEIGNALLISPSIIGNNFGININFRCLKNMEFRSEREAVNQSLFINYLPALTRQHKYALANLHPYGAQAIGEIGGQLDFFYRFGKNTLFGGKYGMNMNANFSYYRNLNYRNSQYQQFLSFGDKKLFQDFNVELERKFSSSFKMIVSYIDMQYNKGAIISGVNEFINSRIVVADMQYKLSSRASVRSELQHLWSKQDDKNWIYGLAEFSLAPKYTVFISDMFNYGQTNRHYLSGGFSFTHAITKLMISIGRHKEGLECVGGICNQVAAYTGVNLSITTSF